MNKPTITIGAGKGKLLGITNQLLTEMGLEPIEEKTRILIHERETDRFRLKITLLRWEDIKNYAKEFDLIIFGSDQWLENGKKSMIALRHFEQKNCRLSLLVPKEDADKSFGYFLDHKIATGYPELAKSYMGIAQENIVKMTGSVEAAVGLGWAKGIFDIVESGTTARMNGLEEYKTFIRFGAVLATCKPEMISTFRELGIIDGPVKRKIIAFDGIDGSGKSTLAKHFVQTGLGDKNPVVLVSPYSGYIGRTAQPLLDAGKYMDWASIIGENHWRPTRYVNMVYDRSILTCLTELIAAGATDDEIEEVIRSWEPLPDILFFCQAPLQTLEHRVGGRQKRDKYEDAKALIRYNDLYQAAAVTLSRLCENVTVIELDTNEPVSETVRRVTTGLEGFYQYPERR